jgi:hypothetical protein
MRVWTLVTYQLTVLGLVRHYYNSLSKKWWTWYKQEITVGDS